MRFRSASMISPSNSIFSSFSAMSLLFRRVDAARGRLRDHGPGVMPLRRDGRDVGRLGALRALALLVLDARALGERLVAVAGDAAVVHEEILRALVRGDEAIPLRVVEPLDGSVSHKKHLPTLI